MEHQSHNVTFTKRRILQQWQQERNCLQYLLPFAKDQMDFLTLGFQMIGRMKPILEKGYNEDYPDDHPYMMNIINWMKTNGWEEMELEFKTFLKEVDKYMKEAL
ncbi:hypothetical protein [Shimazuella kribbensis]|uniref:hypothetical protein n=1 Tax=Shimazuella kribbensis TaxID=139808 RepID=UPI00049070A5|nr:hypothetical protein [Shimazuella kribbensis]